jgi:hypothetical protein
LNIVHLHKGKRDQTLLVHMVDDHTGRPIPPALQNLLHLVWVLRLCKGVHLESLAAQLLLALILAALRLDTRWVLLAVLLVPAVRWGFAAWSARQFERRAFDLVSTDRDGDRL